VLEPGTYYINYGRGNEVEARSLRGAYVDKSFRPFFYVEKDGRGDKLALRMAEDADAYSGAETVQMRTFWQQVLLTLTKIYTRSPIQVKQIATQLEPHEDLNTKKLMPRRATVFAADINYLLNYLVHQEHRMYEGVETLKGTCIDIELTHTGAKVPRPGEGKIIVGGTRKIEANFQTYTIEPIDEYQPYTGDDPDIAKGILQDCFRSQIVIGHNLSFDWSHTAARNKYAAERFTMNRKNFSSFMRGAELSYPKTCFFDTIFAAGVAIPRIASRQLEMLCLNLGLENETSREYLSGGEIPEVWKKDPDRLIKYNSDDINSTIKLANYIFPNIAAPCAYAGLPMENMFLSGPKALWETLTMKYCVKNGILIPHYVSTAEKREGTHINPYRESGNLTIKGAETKRPEPGLYENIVNVDIGACYPTIICKENISPETVMPSVEPTEYRIEWATPNAPVQYVRILPNPGAIPEILKPVMEMAAEIKIRLKTNKELKGLYAGIKAIRNSVAYDENILIQDERTQEIRVVKIGQFVDEILRKHEETAEIKGYRTPTHDPATNHVYWTPITRVYRHPPKNLYKIRTRGGATIKVTEDHSIYGPDGQPLSPKELKPEDILVRATRIPPTDKPIEQLNLIDLLTQKIDTEREKLYLAVQLPFANRGNGNPALENLLHVYKTITQQNGITIRCGNPNNRPFTYDKDSKTYNYHIQKLKNLGIATETQTNLPRSVARHVQVDSKYLAFLRLLSNSQPVSYLTRTREPRYQGTEYRIPLHLLKDTPIPPKILKVSLIGATQGQKRLPTILDIEPVVDLLAWTISEGSHRKWRSNIGESYQTNISNRDKNNRKEIQKIIEELGLTCRSTPRAVICNHKMLYVLLEALDIGHRAPNKKIPGLLFNLHPRHIIRFIKKYIKGDGCWNQTHKQHEIKTTSDNAAHGLVTLLHLTGISKVNLQTEPPKKPTHNPCHKIIIKEPIQYKPYPHTRQVKVKSIDKTPNDKPTYDLEVPPTQRFLCGTNGYLVPHNSAFGFTGVRGGHSRFTNNYAAALVTARARGQVLEVAKRLEAIGGKVFYIDTDGVSATFDRPITDEEIREALKGLPFETDIERYKKGLYLAHKNYILVTEHGKTEVKGSTLVQRSYPQVIRWALKEIIDQYMLSGKEAATETRYKWIKRINEEAKDGYIFSLTYSVREEGAYSEKLGEEHSLRRLSRKIREARGRKIDESETVLLYVAKGSTKTTGKSLIKPVEKWEPYDDFDWNRLDRNWYAWFLDEYILKEILGLDLGQKGRTRTFHKGSMYATLG